MADTLRKKSLEELNSEAIAELERRGYAIRGKTLAQSENAEAALRETKVKCNITKP